MSQSSQQLRTDSHDNDDETITIADDTDNNNHDHAANEASETDALQLLVQLMDDDEHSNKHEEVNKEVNHGEQELEEDAVPVNLITLDDVRDSLVGPSTYRGYTGEILSFLKWCIINRRSWVTAHCIDVVSQLDGEPNEGEGRRAYKKRVKLEFEFALRNSRVDPLVNLDYINPEGFVSYIIPLRNGCTNNFLSRSSLGNKRAALNHLFRLHNRIGYGESFRLELSGLYKGLYRKIASTGNIEVPAPPARVSSRRQNVTFAGPARMRHQRTVSEGKEPMSVELYRSLCTWFLDWNTISGVFGYCILVLTWNLSCRVQNTCLIKFDDIFWTDWDCLKIHFRHMKGDQTGAEAKYPRHLYANAVTPIFCPVFALSVYFSCCFNTRQTGDSLLFPGGGQYNRFGRLLEQVLEEHEDTVYTLGYNLSDIGTHSIRKGSVSYVSSLPGGPPAASICIRAGWTMGKVKDIYMRYVSSGDQFVGRCLSMLNILSSDFGSSCPYFSDDCDIDWINDLAIAQFPMVSEVNGFGLFCQRCLASLLFHRDVLFALPANHVVRISSFALKNQDVLKRFEDKELIVVSYPWNNNSNYHFSGIAPHVAIIQDLTTVKEEQRKLVNNFVDKMTLLLDGRGLNGGNLSTNNLRELMMEATADLRQNMNDIMEMRRTNLSTTNGINNNNLVRTSDQRRTTYTLHFHHNTFSRLPKTWRFPRVGIRDLWRLWWIGDSVKNVPPLRVIEHNDVRFLDSIPLSPEEMQGRSGRMKDKRRLSKKTLSDMRCVMTYIQTKVERKLKIAENICLATVDEMFRVVETEFNTRRRDAQKKWTSYVSYCRNKLKILEGDGRQE